MDTPWTVVALFGAVVLAAGVLGLVWDRARGGSWPRESLLSGDAASEERARARTRYYVHVQDSSNM